MDVIAVFQTACTFRRLCQEIETHTGGETFCAVTERPHRTPCPCESCFEHGGIDVQGGNMICIAGKNRIAVSAAEHVVALVGSQRLSIVANGNDAGLDTWQPSLKKWAEKKGVRVVALEDLYSVPNLSFISLEYDRLVDPGKFLSRNLFNIHFSLLPEYKGSLTSLWPILDGKDYSGVTLHRIDAGIDTGDIIHQERFNIGLNDTCRDVYENYMTVGERIFCEWFERLQRCDFVAHRQPWINSSFRSRKSVDFSNLSINTKQTAFNIHNQIRAFVFREYQMPTLLGHVVCGSTISDMRSIAKPGALVRETEDILQIATIDYDLLVKKDPVARLFDMCRLCGADLAEVDRLLEQCRGGDLRCAEGWTPLIVAAYHHNIEVSKRLVSAGACCNDTNYRGTTVLMYAKSSPNRRGDLSLVKWLVDQGADVNRRDHTGRTILSYARQDEDCDLIRYLLGAGAEE